MKMKIQSAAANNLSQRLKARDYLPSLPACNDRLGFPDVCAKFGLRQTRSES